MIVVKDLGMRKIGKRLQRFGLVKCPECKEITERRIRNDCSQFCKKCSGKLLHAKQADGDTVKTSKYFRLYQIWRGMKRRCYEPNAMGYNLYGAKGVTVCKEWKDSYIAFKKWSLANGYTDTMTIDKDELCKLHNIAPKIYSPKTCIWKPRKENSITNQKVTPAQYKKCAELLEKRLATPEELAIQYNCKPKTILAGTIKYRTKKYKR